MIKESWALVANGSEAYFYKYQDSGKRLEKFDGVANATRRMKDEDIVTDRPGVMSAGGSNIKGQSALAPEESPTERVAKDFAKEIVERLDKARRQDKLASVDIVASPSMLGMIRENFDEALQDLVDKTVNKDLTNADEEQILETIKHH